MRLSTILLVHNSYRYGGGEDGVFHAERALLEAAGHRVVVYHRDNSEIGGRDHHEATGSLANLGFLKRVVWAQDAGRDLRTIIRRDRPQVVHFHNTFPLISPAAYRVARAEGAAVVQTLHNYRLLCPNALFFRGGRPCQDCLGKPFAWPGIVHACYRSSRTATAAVAGMVGVHRALGTWTQMVDAYVALSDFARSRFVAGGLPASKITVKPNFVYPDPGPGPPGGTYVLFAGRLSPDKGVEVLLEAWRQLPIGIPLKIAGTGPLSTVVADAARRIADIEWLGAVSRPEVIRLMQGAAFLVVPSVVYENFPLAVVEAFSAGRAALVSGHGAIGELVHQGHTGLHVRAGNATDLAVQVAWAWAHPRHMIAMGEHARREFERVYTAERNYERLIEIYARAVTARNGK